MYLLLIAGSQIDSSLRAKFGASDIVQFSFWEASRSLNQFRGSSEGEMREWLKQIVLNNLKDHTRRFVGTQKREIDRECDTQATTELVSRHDTPSKAIRHREKDEKLKRLVDQLPEMQRRVIKARHRDGLSYAQIAERLEISEANARQLWSRATSQLREWLQDGS